MSLIDNTGRPLRALTGSGAQRLEEGETRIEKKRTNDGRIRMNRPASFARLGKVIDLLAPFCAIILHSDMHDFNRSHSAYNV